MTYKNASQVVRNRFGNQQGKKVNSSAIFLLVAFNTNFCWGINSSEYQTNKNKNTNNANQTNELNK